MDVYHDTREETTFTEHDIVVRDRDILQPSRLTANR